MSDALPRLKAKTFRFNGNDAPSDGLQTWLQEILKEAHGPLTIGMAAGMGPADPGRRGESFLTVVVQYEA
jgi:hypothetical protein